MGLPPRKTAKPLKRLSGAELGMYVALASFAMLFGTFLLSYGLARLRAPVWPPIGFEPLPKTMPTLSTFLLLVSSVFVWQATLAFRRGNRVGFTRNWNLACALGFGFLVTQVFTWFQVAALGTRLDSNLFGGMFYALTGLHAIHVLGGLGALGWVALRSRKRGFFDFENHRPSQAPKLAALYWHFMDLVWVLMFGLLFWI